ncbi:MAG: energy-coupled thiamine transporter ThiT [Coriobacteriia bacterium]|nr:energy-coupled thiamine transporter ThiT [Coriobacteriia bacterium]
MRDVRIRLIAEIGLAVALSLALNAVFTLLIPFRMPAGGSLSLIMLPIVVLALTRGSLVGITAGLLVGFSDLMFGPYIISIPQMLLDYPIAYGLVGLAGLFALRPLSQEKAASNHAGGQPDPAAKQVPSIAKLVFYAVLGTAIGGLARFAAHVFSGVIFFGQYAPDVQNVWLWSALYNISFMGPNTVAVAICAALAFPLIYRVVRTA